jgi:hypothetical protein
MSFGETVVITSSRESHSRLNTTTLSVKNNDHAGRFVPLIVAPGESAQLSADLSTSKVTPNYDY